MGQLADEADGVGEQVLAARVLVGAGRRIERVEEPVPDPDAGAGDRVEERRLAGVRVAGEGDRRDRGAVALGPHRLAAALDDAELAAQGRDPVPREPPIGLDLRLARAPGADAAVHAAGAEALEVGPEAAHPGEVVLELRELDLELSLGAVGVVGEDVEDHRGAVDDRHAEGALEVALLARRELVVAGDEVGAGPLDLGLRAPRACRGRSSGRDRARLVAGPSSSSVATPAVRSSSRSSASSASSPGRAVDDADRDGALKRARVADARLDGPVAGSGLISVRLRGHRQV